MTVKAEIITVGTEILMGQIVNTNSRDLAEELLKLGCGVYYQTVVGDNRERLEEVFSCAYNRSDIIISTGGLGPTEDDLTKETISKIIGLPLEMNEEWENMLIEFYKRRGIPMARNFRKQALIPKGGILLKNDRGTAPGIYVDKGSKVIILLPGPPRELHYIFENHAVPLLKEKLRSLGELSLLKSKVLNIAGIGESAVTEMIYELMEKQDNPTIASLVKKTEVMLRITAKAEAEEQADILLEKARKEIEDVLGSYIYGEDNVALEEVVATLLLGQTRTIAIAESASGGLFSHKLTNVSSYPKFFKSALVFNDLKSLEGHLMPEVTGVSGTVSDGSELLREYASIFRDKFLADLGIIISPLRESRPGESGKQVWFADVLVSTAERQWVRQIEVWGNLEEIKERASQAALNILRLFLLDKGDIAD